MTQPAPAGVPAAQTARFYAEPPQLESPGQRSWISRGANFVLVLTEVMPGARLERLAQPDEYMVLLPEGGASVSAAGQTLQASGPALTIVPPGDSTVVATTAGRIVRVFSSACADLAALAGNAAAYTQPRPDIAPLTPWPAPPGGWRLRHYPLDDYCRPGEKTRIFRCTNLMVNVLMPRDRARDIRALSPHAHADFEQGSLALAGTWVHHLRTPWTPDMTCWSEDEALEVGSPSLAVIAPTIVHTSRNILDEPAWLVDVFAPPRLDFSLRNMVLNAADYPMPTVQTPAGAPA